MGKIVMGVCLSSVPSQATGTCMDNTGWSAPIPWGCVTEMVRMPDGRAGEGGYHDEEGEEGPAAHPDTAHLIRPWTAPGGNGPWSSSRSASPSPSLSPPWAAATGVRGPGGWQSHSARTTQENCTAFSLSGAAAAARGTTGARLSSTFGRRGTTSSSSAGFTWGSGSPVRRASAAQVSMACRFRG